MIEKLGLCSKCGDKWREYATTIIIAFSEWLEKHNYLDTDWRDELPSAIDRFLREDNDE